MLRSSYPFAPFSRVSALVTGTLLVISAPAFGAEGSAAEPTNQIPAYSKSILVINASAITTQQFDELAIYLRKNIPVGMRFESVQQDGPRDLAAGVALLYGRKAAASPVRVLLASLNDLSAPLVSSADEGWTVVNVSALGLDRAARPQVRINLQVMRGIAASVGVGLCPDAKCVGRRTSSMDETDRLAGAFAPPCFVELLSGLGQRGIEMPKRARPPVAGSPEKQPPQK